MSIFQAIVLGLVQGLTEFLPVSSSGHLVLVPRMLGWQPHPLSFDVALHTGTMLAVLIYFGRDFVLLAQHGIDDLFRQRHHLRCWSPHGRLALLIVVGSLPAVVVGGLFNDWIESNVRQAWSVAVLLVVFGLVMLAAERWADRGAGLEKMDARRALVIGAAQALALAPGVSRSGATIAAGMFAGLSRATAARFSFLLAAPVMTAAAAKHLPALAGARTEGVGVAALAAGLAVSFVVGWLAIAGLLRFVASRPLYVFVWYRLAFAVLALSVLGLR